MSDRVALIIGNSSYVYAPELNNPRNDAQAIGDALEKLQFSSMVETDLACQRMEDVLDQFFEAIQSAHAALFYFAGHGLQVDGENYLIPIDSELTTKLHLRRRAFSLNEILETMEQSARNSLLFIDACRDSPFARSYLARGGERTRELVQSGLAELKPHTNRSSFIAFATAPNHVAFDGSDEHSPFAKALLEHIRKPNLSISDLMIEVRKSVCTATNDRQIPWDQSSLQERFFFNATTPDIPQREAQVHEHLPSILSRSNRHSVYLAASWSEEHNSMNAYVVEKLVSKYGLVVLGDHKAYRETRHERGLKYPQRVNEILQACSGMVIVFPYKNYPQTTAPFIFLELLLAAKHGLPVLLFCEEGIAIRWEQQRDQVELSFGIPPADSTAVAPEDIDVDAFDVTSLRNVHAIHLPSQTLINRPCSLPRYLTDTDDLAKDAGSLIDEFCRSFPESEKSSYVFNIMPYLMAQERAVVASAVFEETGSMCINGSDAWGGGPFNRKAIKDKITNAWFAISDLSGLSQVCIFETGVAVGSGRPTFVITRTPQDHLPFGIDELPRLTYRNLEELDAMIRQHCRGYRRRVFNCERAEWSSFLNKSSETAKVTAATQVKL